MCTASHRLGRTANHGLQSQLLTSNIMKPSKIFLPSDSFVTIKDLVWVVIVSLFSLPWGLQIVMLFVQKTVKCKFFVDVTFKTDSLHTDITKLYWQICELSIP